MEVFHQIDWQEFHFIREVWLWAFIPMLVVLVLVLASTRENTKWKALIAPHLRSHLFTKHSTIASLSPSILFMLIGAFLILSMAGPTWKKVEVPGGKASAVLLIGMDLSQSMLTPDVQPNRLERAKLKINDLLKQNPGTPVGLLAYAGTAHPVVPICTDYNLINHHVESLHPAIMPVRGSQLKYALFIADSIFNRTEAPSTLLLITDDINRDEVHQITHFLQNNHHKINILKVSTPIGGAVPGFKQGTTLRDKSGNTIHSVPDAAVFKELDQHQRVTVYPMTLDNSDVEQIANEIRKYRDFRLDDESNDEQWQDMGWYLLIPALLLLLMWFRKGWMIHWCWIGAFVLVSSCSPDHPQASWWYSNDYQGQFLYQNNQFEAAANHYESLPHKGIAYFKAGNYEGAVSVFELDTSAAGHYNRGLALSQLGQLEEAAKAFVTALETNPNLNQATEQLKQTEQLILQRDSITQLMGDAIQLKESENKTPLKERQASGKDEELTSDTEVDELPDHGDRVTDEVETDITKAEELERPEEMQQQTPQKEAQNIMLRKISADPAEFLKRRFRFQKEKYYADVKESEEIW